MKHTYIYILIDPTTNQVRYIGKTNNPVERYKNHKNRCRDKNTHKRRWINKLRLQNLYPEIEVIDKVPIDKWRYWEKFWIAYYKFLGCDLTNYTSGGDGLTFGNQTSFKKGQTPWNKGSAKPKVKKGFNKKCLDTTFKKGHPTWNKGKSGYNLSGLKKAIPVLQYTKEGVFVKEHYSCSEAAKELNCIPENIRRVCVGKAKTAKNFIFKYKTQEI